MSAAGGARAGLPVPATIDDVTGDWLVAALGPEGDAFSGSSLRAVRIGERYGFFSELYRVTPEASGSPASVVVKLWSTEGIGDEREVLFHRDFGADAGIRLPRCHHGAMDQESRRGVLVLEDIRDGVQGDCLEAADAGATCRLAEQLAALHARWWASPRLTEVGWLPSVTLRTRDREWFAIRKERFLARHGERLRPECRDLFEAGTSVQERSNALLAELPETLLHGDLHLDNVITEPGGRAVVLDWARASRGPAALDLCDVMRTGRPEDAPTIVNAYLAALRDRGAAFDERAMRNGVTGAVLRKLLVCTYGVAMWDPPSDRELRVQHDAIVGGQELVLAWMKSR